MVVLAGCSALGGQDAAESETPSPEDQVAVSNDATNATGVNQTLRIEVDGNSAGEEWTAIGATYPRDRFTVDTAQHETVLLGVDTDGDGELDHEFDESHISGVNTNEFSFDVTLDSGYTLEEGDVVVVRYPAVNNPGESGEYDVTVHLNDAQEAVDTVTIE